jgi:hypothetical protein
LRIVFFLVVENDLHFYCYFKMCQECHFVFLSVAIGAFADIPGREGLIDASSAGGDTQIPGASG